MLAFAPLCHTFGVMQMTKRLNLRIDAKLMRLLKQAAKEKRQSVADIARSAIANHLLDTAPQPTTGGTK